MDKPIAFEFKHIPISGNVVVRFEHVFFAEHCSDWAGFFRITLIGQNHNPLQASFDSRTELQEEEAEEFMKQYREYCGLKGG